MEPQGGGLATPARTIAGSDAGSVPDARSDAAADVDALAQFRMRRAPRYRPFGLTGALLGVLAGVFLALSFTVRSNYSIQTITGYFAAIFGLAGAVLGLGVAILLERRRR